MQPSHLDCNQRWFWADSCPKPHKLWSKNMCRTKNATDEYQLPLKSVQGVEELRVVFFFFFYSFSYKEIKQKQRNTWASTPNMTCINTHVPNRRTNTISMNARSTAFRMARMGIMFGSVTHFTWLCCATWNFEAFRYFGCMCTQARTEISTIPYTVLTVSKNSFSKHRSILYKIQSKCFRPVDYGVILNDPLASFIIDCTFDCNYWNQDFDFAFVWMPRKCQ